VGESLEREIALFFKDTDIAKFDASGSVESKPIDLDTLEMVAKASVRS
jgi:hypothetical protein